MTMHHCYHKQLAFLTTQSLNSYIHIHVYDMRGNVVKQYKQPLPTCGATNAASRMIIIPLKRLPV